MTAIWYLNEGISVNEDLCRFIINDFPNAYDASRWSVSSYGLRTDAPTNVFMRAPGCYSERY